MARIKQGRNCTPSFLIIDAQSVKNTDTAEQKGYDAGKKISGIKRHIAVDILGLPHAITITTANVTDRNGALYAFFEHKDTLATVKAILADGGYRGKAFEQAVKNLLGQSVEVQTVKRNELHRFSVIPKRWIVERKLCMA